MKTNRFIPNMSPGTIARLILAALLIAGGSLSTEAKKKKKDADRERQMSVIDVPEEGGVKFEKITDDSDCVGSHWLITSKTQNWNPKKKNQLTWWVNPQIAVSPDGKRIGYINWKNQTSNVMVKDASQGGASTQRTFRTNVRDFSWTPDGKTICFTEYRNDHYGVFLVDAAQGTVVRQITTGTENDYGGQMTKNGRTIYFHRHEGGGNYSIWSYERSSNLFSNYSRGMTPALSTKQPDVIYCARFTDHLESEIWRINLKTGVEEIILSTPARSFTTPQLSPDEKWILVTGTSIDEKQKRINTDIFAVRTDGTQFTQLTYHPGNDISAIWDPSGKYIYFLSQRGSPQGTYNVWRMNFPL